MVHHSTFYELVICAGNFFLNHTASSFSSSFSLRERKLSLYINLCPFESYSFGCFQEYISYYDFDFFVNLAGISGYLLDRHVEQNYIVTIMAALEHSMDANGAKDAPPPRHIVVLAHGLGGAASDFDRMAQCIRDAYPGRVIVYQADCYEGRTTEGIDVCGQQLYSKILELARHNNLENGCFSILGHSLGGLISRCLSLLSTQLL